MNAEKVGHAVGVVLDCIGVLLGVVALAIPVLLVVVVMHNPVQKQETPMAPELMAMLDQLPKVTVERLTHHEFAHYKISCTAPRCDERPFVGMVKKVGTNGPTILKQLHGGLNGTNPDGSKYFLAALVPTTAGPY